MSARMTSFWLRACETVLMALAFMLPLAFFTRTYDPFAVKVTLFEAGTLGLAFAWLLKGLERGRWELPSGAKPLAYPALALMAWTAARYALAPFKVAALPGFLKQELCLALYLIALLEFGGAQPARRLAAWLSAAGWIAGLYGLSQRLGFDPMLWKGAFEGKIFSTIGSPELFGFFLALCAPMALTQWLDRERDWYLRWTDLALLALLAANVLWTGSAAALYAWLVMSASCALLLPLLLPSRTALKAAGIALAFGAAAALPLLQRGTSGEFAGKKIVWTATQAMIAEAPLAGLGPGSFSVHFPRHRPAELIALAGSHEAQVEQPGCGFLEMLAELGIIGVVLSAWLLAALAAATLQARKRFFQQGALSEACYLAGFSAAALGGLACAQFGLSLKADMPGWLLWPLAGILGGLTLLSRRSTVAVLPLPAGEAARQRAYAPALLAFAGLLAFPVRWLGSSVEHNLAVYYANRGDWKNATTHGARVAPGSETYLAAQYLRGEALLRQDEPQEALKAYAALEALAPDYRALHYRKALAYARLDDWKQAMASHERQRSLDPLFAANFAGLSHAAKRLGDWSAAEQAAELALRLEPSEPAHRLALAEINLKRGRLAAARALQREAARLKKLRKPQG